MSRSATKFIGHYIVFINVEEGKIHFVKTFFIERIFFSLNIRKSPIIRMAFDGKILIVFLLYPKIAVIFESFTLFFFF